MKADGASLARRVVRETARFATLQVFGAVLVWLSSIVLARLLDPHAFGVFEIGMFYVGLGRLLGDGGLGATLLRKKTDVSEEEYRVSQTWLLALGAALAGALALGAPWLGRRYHFAHGEAWVFVALAPQFLLGPLRVAPFIRLERELRFGALARIDLLATILRQSTAVALAAVGAGVWSLVLSGLAGALMQLLLTYRASPGWPGLSLSWRAFRPLIGYGVKVQALTLAAYFKDNLSAVLLGALLHPGAVGVFNFGVKFAQIPVVAVNSLARVQLPVYARLDARDPTLFAAVRATTRTALLVGVPMLVGLAAGGEAVISVVYHNPAWLQSVPVVQGLLLNMVGGLVAGPLFTLLQAQGRAGRAVALFALWTAGTWLLVLALWRLGLGAVAWSYSVGTVLVVLYLLGWVTEHLGRSLAGSFKGPLLAGVAAYVGSVGLRHLPWGPAWVRSSALAMVLSVALYALVLGLLEGRAVVAEVRGLVNTLRHREPPPASDQG